jgi:hypothetical protein
MDMDGIVENVAVIVFTLIDLNPELKCSNGKIII